MNVIALPRITYSIPSRMSSLFAKSAPSNLTVLIVDDDEDMRLYLRSCLRSAGLRNVVQATSGLEALHLARTVSVDLIISDVVMPGLDGYALHRALQADQKLAPIPMLFISGVADPPPAPSPAVRFLAKPFNASTLRARIDLLLKTPPERGETDAI